MESNISATVCVGEGKSKSTMGKISKLSKTWRKKYINTSNMSGKNVEDGFALFPGVERNILQIICIAGYG